MSLNHKKPVCRAMTLRAATFMVIVMAALLGFSGCASLSKAQCLNGDWYEIGLSDGESGTESARFDEYVDTCAKYDVVPDFAKYSEGRTKGLEFFCTRSNGYSEGRQGREYRNVCSGTSEKFFLEGHSLGYNVHSTEEIIEDLNSKILKKNEQIGIWEKEIDELVDVRQARIGEVGQDRSDASDVSSRTVGRREDITEAKTEIKELQDLRAEAIIEYQKAIEEANENGFLEEAKIDPPETRDEANIYGTNP